MPSPDEFGRSADDSLSGWYGGSVRGAIKLVRSLPAAWPRPVRIALQVPLALVAAVGVLAAWVLAMVGILVGSLGRFGSIRP